jgi:predicted CDP-diglyceride synthetase/phosphatidate cytidylyltransferase
MMIKVIKHVEMDMEQSDQGKFIIVDVFGKMKCLFSIAPDARTEGKVTVVVVAVLQATYVVLKSTLSVCRLTLAMACRGGVTDMVVAMRRTHDVSVRRQWRQPGAGASGGELCMTDAGLVWCWRIKCIC